MESTGRYEESGVRFVLLEGEDGDGLFYKVYAHADRADLPYEDSVEQWTCESECLDCKGAAWAWAMNEIDEFYGRHPDLPRPGRPAKVGRVVSVSRTATRRTAGGRT